MIFATPVKPRKPALLVAGSLAVALAGWLCLHVASHIQPGIPLKTGLPPATRKAPLPALLFDEQEIDGEYYFGDGWGVNCRLTLRADHRFRFERRGYGRVCDRNSGSWTLQGDVIVCRPVNRNAREGVKGMGIRYIPVKWGRSLWLVDENQMPGFCDAVVAGDTITAIGLRGTDYVTMEGGKPLAVHGKPFVPSRYREFLDKGAVRAKVISVSADGSVTLDKGSADRVEPGMLFTTAASKDIDVNVVKVDAHRSVGQARYFRNSDGRVEAGDRLTTGDYRTRPHGTGYRAFTAPPAADSGKR